LQPDAATVAWYEDKVRTYGYDHRGLGFRSRSAQEKRFEALLALGDFDGRSLLDVGCGFGDFLGFLQARGIEPLYTGLDICEPMVRRCRERFAGRDARFVVEDVIAFEPPAKYDYVIASGIFGLDSPEVRGRIRPTITRMFSWAREGLAVNFLSRRAPLQADGRVYLEPSELLAMGFELTPAARLDHTYLPNDFTLYLYNTPAWQGDKERTP
jgi:SAM-dependent methyltransferase